MNGLKVVLSQRFLTQTYFIFSSSDDRKTHYIFKDGEISVVWLDETLAPRGPNNSLEVADTLPVLRTSKLVVKDFPPS